ncbi:hypothetical protein CCH79_00013373 [Gambusia affinis]|uniref:Glycerol-3-phosphate dehydrogenase [NAD(+)] n=1 Tax=Gambusia affinis TaxID=33528 RepID=A0A315W8T1_GAMAF|nr:hypothetical protein CCH79_00013373 [Gambusia affinis]
MPAQKVCIVGSGNWGSSIAKIIGHNVKASNRFNPMVNMWVYEEMIDGRKLTEIINTDHENVKYLPGHKLPKNVVAVPDITEAVKGASILVFVIPHQFICRLCDEMKPHVMEGAIGISLIKGIDEGPDGLKLISDIIREKLQIDVSVLMGANIANEVADEKFCETTIESDSCFRFHEGAKNEAQGQLLKELLQTPNFRITVVPESDTVELCGALKNIVAVGAGFCDGLGFGDNTKAAVIRLGLMEMVAFAKMFCKGKVSSGTFLESCGSIAELEAEMLNGQKLQGPQTSAEVYKILQNQGLVRKFPLFVAVYQICYEGKAVKEFITCLQNHPEHMLTGLHGDPQCTRMALPGFPWESRVLRAPPYRHGSSHLSGNCHQAGQRRPESPQASVSKTVYTFRWDRA